MVKVWEDELWVEPFPDRDSRDFEAVIEEYKAYVFAIILRFVSNRDDVQDIAQDVFMQIYRSLPAYQPDHLKAWIGRITINKAIDWKRKQGRIPKIAESYQDDFMNPDVRPGPDIDEQIVQKEREQQVRDLCSKLPPRYNRVLIKYHFQEKSYQQIAREEGISVKTVESRLYRARRLLRERWEEGSQ
ncbi:MAG TPA: RNA polymerase sigma factor [Syntrophomonadaceae bacterium]|nr:RNA polymerase sigma factor [Syntrophomonadaceae bacterium]